MQCTKCSTTSPAEGWSSTRGYCKSCWRDYSRDYRERNKERVVANRKTATRKIAVAIDEFLREAASGGCIDCGETDYRCLDFDHRDQETKFRGLAQMRHGRYSMEKIAAEVAKCDVRCANCHRKRTAEQLGWYKYSASVV